MTVTILKGDCRDVLRTLPAESVHCVVTSPPYFGLRDYGVAGQIGLETTPDAFVAELVAVFGAVRGALRNDGTVWLNLGDSYSGGSRTTRDTESHNKGNTGAAISFRPGNPDKNKGNSNRDGLGLLDGFKPKDLIGIPWRVAFALQADGWYLRQDIIWSKPNPMPESVRDRCTKAHEYLFLLSKSERYYYDQDAIAEASIYAPNTTTEVERAKGYYGGKWSAPSNGSRNDGSFKAIREMRNKRSVWEVTTQPYADAHFATFPPALIEPCILAGCPKGGTVLDPFGGAGTTGLVADRLGRNAILIELNPEYAAMAERRINGDAGMFASVTLG
jgi:DNA modification methylase